MIPLPRYPAMSAIRAGEPLNEAAMARIARHACKSGARILALKNTGSPQGAPGMVTAAMIDAVARNHHRIPSGVCWLDGESGAAIDGAAVIDTCNGEPAGASRLHVAGPPRWRRPGNTGHAECEAG
ncbi:hypothetical protein C4900_15065 [Acidiferrobacter thiooxydans]|uniref:Uncharacterized protein n=2 Tax=Acidiferrobacter thiooxydans TaxID=163359 RepID=A0A1C2G2L4_9GAMM|nr:hypothetical protein C4900_15065 [Acidiferrobacter thiooxydans]